MWKMDYSLDFFGGFLEGKGSILWYLGVVLVVVGPGVGLLVHEYGVVCMYLVVTVVEVWFSEQQTLKTIFILSERHRPPTLLWRSSAEDVAENVSKLNFSNTMETEIHISLVKKLFQTQNRSFPGPWTRIIRTLFRIQTNKDYIYRKLSHQSTPMGSWFILNYIECVLRTIYCVVAGWDWGWKLFVGDIICHISNVYSNISELSEGLCRRRL